MKNTERLQVSNISNNNDNDRKTFIYPKENLASAMCAYGIVDGVKCS